MRIKISCVGNGTESNPFREQKVQAGAERFRRQNAKKLDTSAIRIIMSNTNPMKFKPVTDAELTRIDQMTNEKDSTEPRLVGAAFDGETRRLLFQFKNDASLAVPVDLFNGFENATAEQIAKAKVVSNGAALHWDDLDVQMTTMSIVQRAFKLVTASDSARKAGSVSSEAKRAAVRVN